MDFLGIGASLLGGLLGGSDSGSSQTQTRSMDPRMDNYVYGKNGNGGLLGTAYNLMNQQLAGGGLNPLQRYGLALKQQYLMSPQYQQGYNNMANIGNQLMSGGVAGNPFMTGRMGNQGLPQPQQAPQAYMSYKPQFRQVDEPVQIAKTDPEPTQLSVNELIDDYMRKNGLGKYAQSFGAEGGA